MENKNLLEDNKLIIEFMGGKEVDWFKERVIIIPWKEGYSKEIANELLHFAYDLEQEVNYLSSIME